MLALKLAPHLINLIKGNNMDKPNIHSKIMHIRYSHMKQAFELCQMKNGVWYTVCVIHTCLIIDKKMPIDEFCKAVYGLIGDDAKVNIDVTAACNLIGLMGLHVVKDDIKIKEGSRNES